MFTRGVFFSESFFCEKIVASGFWYVHLNQLLTFKSVTSNYHGKPRGSFILKGYFTDIVRA